jgi:hypothetical protein
LAAAAPTVGAAPSALAAGAAKAPSFGSQLMTGLKSGTVDAVHDAPKQFEQGMMKNLTQPDAPSRPQGASTPSPGVAPTLGAAPSRFVSAQNQDEEELQGQIAGPPRA